ncbi:MAG: helix-turn-helix domain-containing protein [Rhodobacter sp.]|uniref:MerR family transcriptional regulator n=1 Tax=Pararhodobacter sp. TaxID=2127056 RepID=UPI001D9553C1|nr:helix-turn-helix domain-containing protein [Pararhodobacter sp.]MCB1344185.1 helix-turn-helix domain-containing protein [Paracoccaceae bacterium]MCC0074200.1 helix-turn-helix domain-containing protein [Rhodobacter sp.]HPD93268.1 helix-turn-helix domain-containing protein [Pararhodobacter sp.]
MKDLTIGEAARASGVKVTTIRFYEDRGLLPAPPRTEGNRRLYDPGTVARLTFIRHARDLGFALEDITDLLDLQDQPHRSCAAADSLARRHLRAVEARIAALTALRGELRRMTEACDGAAVETCRVIESLADHGRCAGEHGAAIGTGLSN